MAPLAVPTDRPNTGRKRQVSIPLAADAIALRHTLFLLDATGLGVDPAVLGAETFGGVVVHGFDNTGGAAGVVERTTGDDPKRERYCIVARDGEWDFPLEAGAAPVRDAGAYYVDNNTVSDDDAIGTRPLVGKFTVAGDLGWFVDIEAAF